MTVTGTATDSGGGIVAAVEVSLDGGHTWHRATGTDTWTYTGSLGGTGHGVDPGPGQRRQRQPPAHADGQVR